MGGGVAKFTPEQSKEIVGALRETYEEHAVTAGDDVLLHVMSSRYEGMVKQYQETETKMSPRLQLFNTTELFELSQLMNASLKGSNFDALNFVEEEKDDADHVDDGGWGALESLEETSPVPVHTVDPWTQTMDMRSGEVEFLLRRPINNDEDIMHSLNCAEAGIQFLEELDRVAESNNMNRGTISRWLLPFDTSTSITDQASTFSSVEQSTPEELKGKITTEQLSYLVNGVNGIRQLVRVKIADDNDLETAKEAVKTTAQFLKRLQSAADELVASGQSTTPFDLLRDHEYRF
jgi:hypothetical protein